MELGNVFYQVSLSSLLGSSVFGFAFGSILVFSSGFCLVAVAFHTAASASFFCCFDPSVSQCRFV